MTENPSPNALAHDDHLLRLPLNGLLPAYHTLIIDPVMRTVSLLSQPPEEEAQILVQRHFSPNGMCVLVPLLQAYPHYCPYDVLLASLYPQSLDEARRQLRENWDLMIRPIRRAIGSIVAGLRAFGLAVRSIRSVGYFLEALVSQPA